MESEFQFWAWSDLPCCVSLGKPLNCTGPFFSKALYNPKIFWKVGYLYIVTNFFLVDTLKSHADSSIVEEWAETLIARKIFFSLERIWATVIQNDIYYERIPIKNG